MASTQKILLIILALFLPFVSVGILKGCGRELLINILLCLLFYIPGMIHAIYCIVKDEGEEREGTGHHSGRDATGNV